MQPDLSQPISKLVRLTKAERKRSAVIIRLMKRQCKGELTLAYACHSIYNRFG